MVNSNDKNIHHVDLYVGERLKQKRLERGISQDDLAGSVNLTFQQVQKYEKGVNRVSASKLYDFSKFLNTNIYYIIYLYFSNDYTNPYFSIIIISILVA